MSEDKNFTAHSGLSNGKSKYFLKKIENQSLSGYSILSLEAMLLFQHG
jgi:hypothetical protein